MFNKFFTLSLRNIRHRSLRSWLTIIGIIVGVALIVSLISLGKGLENSILHQLKMFGTDLITVFPGEESDPLLGVIGGGSLRDKEIAVIEDVPGVDFVIPLDISYLQVEYKGEINSTTVHGSPMKESKEIYTQDRGAGIESGVWPTREDEAVVLLGNKFAKTLFREEVHVGEKVRIKGRDFKVVGILEEIGSSEDDNAVYMSLYNFRKITGTRGSVRMAMVKILDSSNAKSIAEEIKFVLRKERGSADVTVLTSEQAVTIVGDIIGTIQIAVLFIAIFSIIVGAIGVMNTMYTSVLERRREIGIMKALGATNSDILNIFMIESGVIGLIGGVIGTIIGVGLAKGGEIAAFRSGFKFLKAYMGIELIGGVLFFAFILGIISGVFPARQAAKLKPAEALRYE